MFRIEWAIGMPNGKTTDHFYTLCDDVFAWMESIMATFTTAFIVEVI